MKYIMNDNFLVIPFSSSKAKVYMSLAAAGDMGQNTSPINENRLKFFKDTGLKSPDEFPLVLKQIHSRVIYRASELEGHKCAETGLFEGDGIISLGNNAGDRALGVSIADCIPIFLYDSVNGACGAFHSGWRGTGIAADGVKRMVTDFGSRPENIEAVIGPGIEKCCYKVGKKIYDYFSANFGTAGLFEKNCCYYLDLKTVNKCILEKCGVKKIKVSPYCTCCNEKFFSYRRFHPEDMDFPRMLAYIRILE